jgi:hypothetical protein
MIETYVRYSMRGGLALRGPGVVEMKLIEMRKIFAGEGAVRVGREGAWRVT